MVCELWMRPLRSHVSGVHFGSEYHSSDFARTLELAVGSVDTTHMLPGHRGLVQVFPPDGAQSGSSTEQGALPFAKQPTAA